MSEKKLILVTNDDGVNSEGICAAYDAVKDLGRVIISAPATQKSGVGRSISIFDPLRIIETKIKTGQKAYAIGGTPTDSVILGIHAIMKDLGKPDLILSGFNIGENVSTDSTTTSGTIGAALEGASYGIPAIAVSLQIEYDASKKILEKGSNENEFVNCAVQIVRKIASHVLKNGLPPNTDLLNVNIPIGVKKGSPIAVTRLSGKYFKTEVEERFDPKHVPYYWISGGVLTSDEDGTDVQELHKGCVTLTPISLDSTSFEDMKYFEKHISDFQI